MRSFFETWFQFTGAKSEIERIREELEPHCSDARFIDGVYASFSADIENVDILKEICKKYPACEYYLSYGLSKYGGMAYEYSQIGSDTPISDIICTDMDGKVDEFTTSKKDVILYYGGYRTTDISISLKNGGVAAYRIPGISYDNFMREPITLAALSNCCNTYVSEAHKKKFAKEFLKDIGSLDQVERIHFTYEDIRTDMTRAEKSALSEPSLAEFLYSHLSDMIIREYDLTSNTVKQTRCISIYAPENPNGGKPDYIFHTIKEDKYEQAIIGVQNEDKAELLFTIKTEKSCVCTSCLSDIELIEIPAEGLAKTKVTELGKACILDLKNVRKVILPNTLTSFGVGNFTGCKNLKQIVFADAPESKDDLIILKKTALKGVITLKTSFDVPEDITELGKFVFSNSPKLKSVRLSGNVEKIHNDAFAETKTLKTLILTENVKTMNLKALEKSKINEIVMANGETVKIQDPYMYQCLVETENGLVFSYEKAAKNLLQASTEAKRYKIAYELFFNHTDEVGSALSDTADFLIRYCIGNDDVATISAIMEKKLPLQLDITKLAEQSNRAKKTEITALLLSFRMKETVEVKNVSRVETPAKLHWCQLYIKVRFENNKSYSYFCNYDVNVGDKVFVPGKMAGQPGEVIDVSTSSPSGTKAAYTLSVEKAFNVTEVSLDDDFDF